LTVAATVPVLGTNTKVSRRIRRAGQVEGVDAQPLDGGQLAVCVVGGQGQAAPGLF